jgi:nitroreductase
MHAGAAATHDVYDASNTHAINAQVVGPALAEAAAAAGYAPSIHDTQPWRWRIGNDTLDLYREPALVRAATDPDARLATLSCGTALHHARTVLAAAGWHVNVARMPDAADQEHLAHMRAYAPAAPDLRSGRRLRTIPLRHTDRRPVTGAPVGLEDLSAIVDAVQVEGAWLSILKPDQVAELSTAANVAVGTMADEHPWRAELAYWTDHPDTLTVSAAGDRAARFAILYGRSDESRDWLRAGEALSAAWLTATERGISVLPMSAPVEVTVTRESMRRILAYLSHPFLVLRLGTVDPAEPDASYGTRRPAEQTVERR